MKVQETLFHPYFLDKRSLEMSAALCLLHGVTMLEIRDAMFETRDAMFETRDAMLKTTVESPCWS